MANAFATAPGPTRWYPRIDWSTNRLDLTMPVTDLAVPEPEPIEGRNVANSGAVESLGIRVDRFVSLSWAFLPFDQAVLLQAFIDNWGLNPRRQSVLILDRYLTCQDQWEFTYNAFFTKAILWNTPKIRRSLRTRPLYNVQLVFIQGV